MAHSEFWLALDRLIATSNLIIDRPKGSLHPHYPSFRYPLDYGYLQGTKSPDGDGIDVWVGSLRHASPSARTVTGIVATLDLDKRDAELKLLLNCTAAEAQIVIDTHNRGLQTGILVHRTDVGAENDHD